MGAVHAIADAQDRQRVYRQLKSAMINCLFRPGEQMMVGDLAERLGVSPTPVREALIGLRGEFLLDPTRRRGFFARTLDVAEMGELFQLCFSILQFAVERLGELPEQFLVPNLPRLRIVRGSGTFLPDSARLPDSTRHSERLVADRASKPFCEELIASIGNATMMSVLRNANERTQYIRTIDLETPARADELTENIEGFLTNLERNNFGGAIAILKRNFDRQIDLLPSLVKEGISRAYLRPSWPRASVLPLWRTQQRPLVAGRGSAIRR
jgi:DNA-binding GntR family transcriptional regulator